MEEGEQSMKAMHYIAVDLGGTTLTAAAVDMASGAISGRRQIPTLSIEGPEAVMARMSKLTEETITASGLSKDKIGGVGIGVPGVLDMERGYTVFLCNMPTTWPQVPLQATIEEKVGLPASILNDVRAFTLGEKTFGAGRDVDTLVCMAIGTGIGGGIVVNGQLHLGISGTAGEVGHQVIEANGPPCACGSRGCLETLASGAAITAMALKAITQGVTTRITDMVENDLNAVTPEIIAQAASKGDAVACEIFERAGYYLGIGVANLITVISARMVIIGGGVAQAGDLLFDPLRRTVMDRVRLTPMDQVQIVGAQLGTDAGLVGAAVWASERATHRAED
jgi:glucokinase